MIPPDSIRGTALRWSDECFRIFGYEPGQVAVTNDLFFAGGAPGRSGFGPTAAFVRAIRETGLYRSSIGSPAPTAPNGWSTSGAEVIADSDGRPTRVLGTCQDITERRRAEAALARYAHRLECLRAIDLAILSSRSPREIAEAALANLTRLVNYWTASVCVFDPDRGEVEVIADAGILREWYPPGSRLGERLGGQPEIEALRDGRAWSEEDLAGACPASPVLEALRAAGMRSCVLLPLLDNGPLAGALFLGSDRPAAFSPEQIEVAREVADQLAIALRQAQLFEAVEARGSGWRTSRGG